MSITVDTSQLTKGFAELSKRFKEFNIKALRDVAKEILRLTTFEVPHDQGMLQASGSAEPNLGGEDEYIVGYNKVYAARLHEHPEYHFQKGRKGKYLEDPIKNNLPTLLNFYGGELSGAMT